jgi:hypothetical protein
MHERAKRSTVKGWTANTVRRHTKFLYSVNTADLDGFGYAPTLTLRDCPPDSQTFHALRRRWIKRVERKGSARIHWVIEWQRRGVPHMHTAVYFDRELSALEQHQLTADWVDIASDYGTTLNAQHCAPIDGPAGWLQYLSKHAARGAAHYQRQGKPSGWESTGRLWGHTGSWPVDEALSFDVPQEALFRFRRMVRSWRIADARAESDELTRRRRIRSARRMLACNDRKLSEVRGISEWIPQDQLVRYLALLADQGYAIRQV